jgi:hypothetical protein
MSIYATCIDEACQDIGKERRMLLGRREVSLAAEFEPSTRPYKTMLGKLVLKAHVVGSEINNMTAYTDTDTVFEMLYGSTKSTLRQEAVKIYLWRVHVEKFKV